MPRETGKERPARAMAAAEGAVPAHRDASLSRHRKARPAQSARIGAGDDRTRASRLTERRLDEKLSNNESRKFGSPARPAPAAPCVWNGPRAVVLDAITDRRADRSCIRYRRRAPQPDCRTKLLLRSKHQSGRCTPHRELRADRRPGPVPTGTLALRRKRSPIPRIILADDPAPAARSHLRVASAIEHDLALPGFPLAVGDLSSGP